MSEKMKWMAGILLLTCTGFISACEQGILLGAPGKELEPDEVDTSLPTTARISASNGIITIEFLFKGPMELEDGSQSWTEEELKIFQTAAKRWLQVVRSPGSEVNHKVTIYVQTRDYEEGLGAASPYFDSMKKVSGQYFPTEGEILMAAYAYSDDFEDEFEFVEEAETEFEGIILHELGHVFGIGTLWNLGEEDDEIYGDDEEPNLRRWAPYSEQYQGYYYERKNGLSAYRQIFGDWDVVPLLNDAGHVYFEDDDNPSRTDKLGRKFPSADYELMGDGVHFSIISAGFLEDLGWQINRKHLDAYPH